MEATDMNKGRTKLRIKQIVRAKIARMEQRRQPNTIANTVRQFINACVAWLKR